jgi:hypothetical protein
MKESAIASHVRLFAAQSGVQLWRNNVGACVDSTGRMIRYGLCNDSAALAKRIKSSDYIGITPVTIQPFHVGTIFGIFTAVETKAEDWVFSGSDDRAVAQKAFHDIVTQSGGLAGFACNVDDFKRITGK